ncbi:UNVERIFIED_CONTAM: putative boron transporter 6 [Sesamum latifolium]|uniref:Boron transporter 6 n=1 Tax=Sesamum latifolium TaxID=2727402 RepID=A0AAW2X2I4_9LAMI
MDNPNAPLAGVIKDFKGRLACYKSDWIDTCGSGARILAPTAYIFFASALPVIAFGEQLSRDTEGILSPVETLASTAICGVIHAVFGGQPLLILGVAEPTIIMYHYLYDFAKSRIGRELYLAWVGWVCFWTAMMLFLLAIFNACTVITRFTRVAGELFGMLITILFIQEAIRVIRDKMVKCAKEGMKEQVSHTEIYGRMHTVFVEMDSAPSQAVEKELADLKEAVVKHDNEGESNGKFDPEKCIDLHLPVRVNEQRVSNFLQSVAVGLAICAMPVIKMIPTSVLWGYFAYMGIEGLPGNQFWERMLLLLVPPRRRFNIREHLLPKVFPPQYLQELDAAEYEEIIGHPSRRSPSKRDGESPDDDSSESSDEFTDAEILDEMTTHRGELKHRSMSSLDRQFPVIPEGSTAM